MRAGYNQLICHRQIYIDNEKFAILVSELVDQMFIVKWIYRKFLEVRLNLL